MPEAARPPAARARRCVCRSASWAARSACCTPAGRTGAARRRAGRAADDARHPGGRAHRNRACVREDAAPGVDRRADRTDQPANARDRICARCCAGDAVRARRRRPRPLQAAERHPRPRGRRPLVARLRPSDRCRFFATSISVARWGGEEFVIALPDARLRPGGRRPRAGPLESRDWRTRVGTPPFTASFGVTDSSKAESMQELIQLADVGLYMSKAAGRDRISVADALTQIPAASTRNGNGRAPQARDRRGRRVRRSASRRALERPTIRSRGSASLGDAVIATVRRGRWISTSTRASSSSSSSGSPSPRGGSRRPRRRREQRPRSSAARRSSRLRC